MVLTTRSKASKPWAVSTPFTAPPSMRTRVTACLKRNSPPRASMSAFMADRKVLEPPSR